MEKKSESIESKVMSQIESGRVKVRSRYLFVVEKLGLGSAFVLTVILAVLFFSLFFFYLRATDSLVYLSFGEQGIFAFFESFPYALVIAVIVLVLVGGFLLRKSDMSYKKPFRYFALGMVLFMVAAGSALAYTHVVDIVEEQAYYHFPSALFNPFFASHARHRGMAGQITAVTDNLVIMQAPCGVVQIDTSKLSIENKALCVVGKFIVAAGVWSGEDFIATRLHSFDADDLPLTARHVRRIIDLPPPAPGGVPVVDTHCR